MLVKMNKVNHKKKFDEFTKKQKRRRNYLLKKHSIKQVPPVLRKLRHLIEISINKRIPNNFSIKENTIETIKFINDLKVIKSNRRRIFLNMSSVTNITNGTIALLVSVIKELGSRGYKISGNKPKNKEANKILEKSGFFDHIKGEIEYENKFTTNTILREGEKAIAPQSTAQLVRKAMKNITGKEQRNKKVQGLFIELMANSINHGFPRSDNKKWVLSASNDETTKKSSFTFIDNGVGILKTLEPKILDKVLNILNIFKGKNDLLLSAFKGEIGSRTGLSYRGRGLPFIYDCINSNRISNLFILTNNVILDFANNSFYEIDINFNGTLYYFEIDERNDYEKNN